VWISVPTASGICGVSTQTESVIFAHNGCDETLVSQSWLLLESQFLNLKGLLRSFDIDINQTTFAA